VEVTNTMGAGELLRKYLTESDPTEFERFWGYVRRTEQSSLPRPIGRQSSTEAESYFRS
jgi:hypothetical protein